MKLEINKTYRRRDRRISPPVVKIVRDDGSNAWYPMIGDDHRMYTTEGECNGTKKYDLIEELK